jgi:predicted PurR-regulated permease PerM
MIPADFRRMNGAGQASGTRAVLLTVVIVVAVLRFAQDVFIPLALAILLTFMLAPLVNRLQAWGVNRLMAVVVSITIALALVGALTNVAFNQFADLAHELPGYQRQLHQNLTHIRGAVRGGVADASKAVEQLGEELQRVAPGEPLPSSVGKVQVIEPPAPPLTMIKDFIGPLLKPLGTAIVVIVLVSFMLLRLHDLRERIISVLGRRNLYATTKALNDAAQRVSRYLLVQLAINTWTGVWVGVGLWLLDVPNPGLWGALALILRFIPYVGVWSAGVLPFALSFAVSDDLSRPVLVFGLFAILEIFNYGVFEPWLYANHTGISPVALLLSAAFWTWLWGGVGLFLSIPMTVCVVVMSKYIPQLEFLQVLLGDEPVLEPHQRLYQRLLAANRDTADSLLEDTLRSRTMLDACDRVIVPAIRLLESDYDRRALGAARRKTVLQHVDQWVEERLEILDSQGVRENSHGREIGGNAPWILCVPAADRADEVVAKLLAAALLERGLGAAFVRPDALDELPLEEDDRKVDAVVVSALPPEAVSPARAVCRRIRARSPDLPLMVGLWDPEDDLFKPRQRLEAAGAGRVVVTFAECVEGIEAMTAAAQASLALPPPAPRGAVLQT